MNWYRETIPVLEETLHTSQTVGLTEAAAAEQLQAVGPNRLKEKPKKTFLQRFVEQLKDFMVIILIIAAVISMISTILEGTNDWLEPIIIIGIVLVNAFLGVIQESKAEAALEALQSMASPTAKVVRNGQQISIPSENVVPGDLLILEAGDFIPADARLIESASLRCEESALTGESVPSEKDASVTPAENAGIGDRVNMVYSGCSVSYGRGKALVTATGMQTEMGKIATMLESTEAMTTPLQLKLAQLGKTLGILALAICGIIFLIGFATGGELLEMFMTAVSLAVAAIPEGLPAIVTIVLAMGVQRMVKKNAIIKSLPAVETLGSASVICSDKTGTLTLNRMTMMEVYCNAKKTVFADEAPDEDTKKFLTLSALCCDGNVEIRDGEEIHIGDPTETGIVAAALQHTGHTKAELDQRFPRVAEIPFDSDRKLMTTVNMLEGKPYAIVKGAPDLLLERCISVDQDSVLKANREMAENALRVLAVAIKPLESVPDAPTSDTLENGLTFLGLLGMIDPPRPEAAVAVRTCHEAGIRTVMITGDHVITASAIAKDLGIMEEGQKAVSGQELKQMSEADLENEVENISVYARVSPEDKIRIVQAWQKKDHVVAMTGDGVNDAPALKAADIGCAMGITGTDVAKGAAAMILTDDNFSTIVTAVEQGRGIFDNIRKAVHFLLSCNLGEIIAVFASILIGTFAAGWGVPLLPVQLLWINLVTDSLPALALGMEPVEKDVMQRRPRKKDESIFSGGLGFQAVWQGLMFAVITLAAYWLGLHYAPDGTGFTPHDYAQTMAFAALAFSQLVHAMNVRSTHSLFKAGWFSNKYMWGAFLVSSVMMLAVLFVPPLRTVFSLVPLNGSEWGEIILLSLSPLVICELVKLFTSLFQKHKKSEKRL